MTYPGNPAAPAGTIRTLNPNILAHPNRRPVGKGPFQHKSDHQLPIKLARSLAASGFPSITDVNYARYLDRQDSLWQFRNYFGIPNKRAVWPPPFRARMEAMGDEGSAKDKENCAYFAGNSLGLMPIELPQVLKEEMSVWGKLGVLGHTEHPTHNWVTIDSLVRNELPLLAGANPSEVACMGSLTANLHALLTSFYKPTPRRHKILYEAKAFPSDEYAFASQVALHDYPPSSLLALAPLPGEYTLRMSNILKTIEEEGDSIAVICFSGVQYHTGQLFDMEAITRAGHAKGCLVAFDLAHAIGNVPLHLHDWGVDFAAWCSYKYLNAGPGGIAGLYVHSRHENHKRLQGWWGHDSTTRFDMPSTFSPQRGAAGWQFSNPSVLDIMTLHTSLKMFGRAAEVTPKAMTGNQVDLKFPIMGAIREKSILLTDYLEVLLVASRFFVEVDQIPAGSSESTLAENEPDQTVYFTIITPRSSAERGAQLSLLFSPHDAMPSIFDRLREHGILGDERQPGIIRIAPAPLWNSFEEVLVLAGTLERTLEEYPKWKEAKAGREKLLEEKRKRTLEKGKTPTPQGGEESDEEAEMEVFEPVETLQRPKVDEKGKAYFNISNLPEGHQERVRYNASEHRRQHDLFQLESLHLTDNLFGDKPKEKKSLPLNDGDDIEELLERMRKENKDQSPVWQAKQETKRKETALMTEAVARDKRKNKKQGFGPPWKLPESQGEELRKKLELVSVARSAEDEVGEGREGSEVKSPPKEKMDRSLSKEKEVEALSQDLGKEVKKSSNEESGKGEESSGKGDSSKEV